jgi:hypothetical protein
VFASATYLTGAEPVIPAVHPHAATGGAGGSIHAHMQQPLRPSSTTRLASVQPAIRVSIGFDRIRVSNA